MVQERKFRADLYYGLNVFPITLPPLRQREGDIPLLIESFVKKFATRQGRSVPRIPDQIMEQLKRHHWPGNILVMVVPHTFSRNLSFNPHLHILSQTGASATRVGLQICSLINRL